MLTQGLYRILGVLQPEARRANPVCVLAGDLGSTGALLNGVILHSQLALHCWSHLAGVLNVDPDVDRHGLPGGYSS